MAIPTLPEITPKTITTSRLTTRVLFSGTEDGIPVVFLHGNTSSATWWEEVLASLPAGFRGIALDQRGFGEADREQKIDATRGMGDWADDIIALLDELGITKAHVVGNSLGGSAVWRLMIDYPERLLSAVQVNPGSPYGFGGIKGLDGVPCFPDYAGSGGGLANQELIKRMMEGDRSMDNQSSPRVAIRTVIVKPPFVSQREEELLSALLSMHMGGPQDSPGDFTPSANWPFVAPGKWGAANAVASSYAGDVNRLYNIQPKVPVLWIRGSHDLLVSDTSYLDAGYLGQIGLLPGWPGAEIFPPQPMVSQTRAVLEKYAAAGGSYKEVVIQDGAHAPYIDQLDAFNAALHRHLAGE